MGAKLVLLVLDGQASGVNAKPLGGVNVVRMDWKSVGFEACGVYFKWKSFVGQWEAWLVSRVVGGGFTLRKGGEVVSGGGGKGGDGRASVIVAPHLWRGPITF